MNQLLRFFMIVLITLALVVGQEFFVISEANMACCQKALASSSPNCCSHPATAMKVQHKSAESCYCRHTDQISIYQGRQLQHELKSELAADHSASPTKGLQLTDSSDPIWLYWQFQPDRIRLYQQKNSWLL